MAQVTSLYPNGVPGRKYAVFIAKPEAVAISYTAYGVFLPVEDGVPRYFEVHMRAVSGTAYAQLYDVTAAAAVASSQLSTASTSMVRLRTATRLTLTEDSEYRAEFSAADGKKQAARLTYG